MRSILATVAVLALAATSFALPSTDTADIAELDKRVSPTNEVSVKSKTNFWYVQ